MELVGIDLVGKVYTTLCKISKIKTLNVTLTIYYFDTLLIVSGPLPTIIEGFKYICTYFY